VFSIHAVYVKLYNNRVPILGSGWDLEIDRSYAEMFGYMKTVLILYLLMSIPRVWKCPIYLVFHFDLRLRARGRRVSST
jgi:hypothetical protein